MKRYLGALAVAVLVFGVALASAAALRVNGGAVQVGSDEVKCDRNGVRVASYRVESSNVPQPISTGVRVTGISSRCEGADIFAKVYDGGQKLAFGKATIDGDGEVLVRYRNDARVVARDITRVQITIDG